MFQSEMSSKVTNIRESIDNATLLQKFVGLNQHQAS